MPHAPAPGMPYGIPGFVFSEVKSLLLFELKKITDNRAIRLFLLIFLILNLFLAWNQAGHGVPRIPVSELNAFFDYYFEHPDEVDANYKKYQDFQEELTILRQQAMMVGKKDIEEPVFENVYSVSESYDDGLLYNFLFNTVTPIRQYGVNMQKIIDVGRINIQEYQHMGLSKDSYAVRYQEKVLTMYAKAQAEVRMGFEYPHGWSTYFGYTQVNLFIFVLLILLGTVIFAQEKNTGTLPLIRAARYGHTRTALTKIAALYIAVTVIVLLFTAETFIAVGLRCGYSSPFNAIQILTRFYQSPYVITIGQYFVLNLVIRLLTFYLFASVIMVVSTFIANYALIYVSGLGFLGLNFFLNSITYFDLNNFFCNMNLFATANVNALFERYRALNFFNLVVGFLPLLFITFPLLIIAASALTVFKHNRGSNPVIRKDFAAMIKAKLKALIPAPPSGRGQPVREYSKSLFLTELHKTLISSRMVIPLVILLVIKIYLSGHTFVEDTGYAESVYKEYMTQLAGEVTDEKREFLRNERASFQAIITGFTSIQSKYEAGQIDATEFFNAYSAYNKAVNRMEHLARIEAHLTYIDRMAREDKTAWFVYDTGWDAWLLSTFDWTLYAAILLLFAGLFASEYDSKSSAGSFAQILRASKYGRKPTFLRKLAVMLLITAILSLLWNSIDAFFVTNAFEMPLSEAPIHSLQSFETAQFSLSLGQYLVFYWILRLLICLLLGLLIAALSLLLRTNIAAISAIAAITILPMLLSRAGLSLFKGLDFMLLMRGTPILILGWHVFGLSLGFYLVIVALLLWRAERKWNR